MEKIAVFVNDAEHARHIVRPMLDGAAPAHWVIVAVPPTLTRHIGRWVSNSARQQWLTRWSDELFARIEALLREVPGSKIEKILVKKRPLPDVAARLRARLGPVRLLDARRPRVGVAEAPLNHGQPGEECASWAYPAAATAGLSVMLTLVD